MNKQKLQAIRDKASECFHETAALFESASGKEKIELLDACKFFNDAMLALDDAAGIEE
jgi:hypothetical protein